MFSPFLTLFIALQSYRTSLAKNIIWAFAIFYGVTFVISSEGIDAAVYAESLTNMHQRAMTLAEVTAQFYNEEGGGLDFIQPLLTFLVSLFTDSYHILYGVFCLVFGFFYSRNVCIVLDGLKGKINREIFFLVVVFATIIPLWSVNGVRMWTAAHMFVYGALPYLMYNKKGGLVWCIISIFMHFSFLFPLAILGVFILVGNRTRAYFWLFIISFLLSQWNLTGVSNLLQNILPAMFQKKAEAYTGEEYGAEIVESLAHNNFYAVWYQTIFYWTIVGLLVMIFIKGKRFFVVNPVHYKLLGFTYLIFSIAILVSGIPSMGRFILVAELFALVCIILYLHYAVRIKLFHNVLPFAYASMLFFLVVSVRIGFDTVGVMTIIGNPVTACFKDTEAALIQFIK